jgi:hypothetical protein
MNVSILHCFLMLDLTDKFNYFIIISDTFMNLSILQNLEEDLSLKKLES